ncbi:STX17 [Acrasis kona]|uniref:STX17 n=1 Tax=Acrasis kona TaxID=1008807 RepID=A0AAW2YH61_9EUKA
MQESGLEEQFEKIADGLNTSQAHIQKINRYIKSRSDNAHKIPQLIDKAEQTCAETLHDIKIATDLMKSLPKGMLTDEAKFQKEFALKKYTSDLKEVEKQVASVKKEHVNLLANKESVKKNREEKQSKIQDEFMQQLIIREDEAKSEEEIEAETEREMRQLEQGVMDVVELMNVAHDQIHQQEYKLEEALLNVEETAALTEKGTRNLQIAAKWKGIGAVIGATAIGGAVGLVVGGPIGAVVAANTALGVVTTVGATATVGLSLGAVGGLLTKTISDKVDGSKLKFWKKDEEPIKEEIE